MEGGRKGWREGGREGGREGRCVEDPNHLIFSDSFPDS